MRKIVITLIVLVLAGAGFFVYKWFGPREQADPFSIVPENAALIIETSQIYNVWDEFKSRKVWKNVKAVPSIDALTQKISALDSILVQENKREFFEGKKVVASLHLTSAKNLDYIFYIPVNSSKEENFLSNILSDINQRGKYLLEERKFNDYTIGSITSKESKISFSYMTYKNLFIGSFSAVLLEDLVRSIDKKKNFFFWKRENSTPQKLVEGKTSLYVRFERLPSLLALFSESPSLKFIEAFAEESVLELTMNDRELLLNGFTYASSKKTSFISNFKNQQPQQFYLKNYVPNTTNTLYYYGFDKGKALRKSLEVFWQNQDPQYLKEVKTLNDNYKIDIGSLYDDFGKEIGLCDFGGDTTMSPKVVFIHSNDVESLFFHLGKIVTQVSDKDNSKPDNELWQGVKICEMNIEEFPSMLLGKLFTGFPKTYFAMLDDYIVFSNSKQGIKNLVKDVEGENVWGKTLSINSSLEETIAEFNVGVFVNVQKSWQTLLTLATPETKGELEKNQKMLQGFDILAAQFSHLNETVLTNIVLTHDLPEVIAESEEDNGKKELVFGNKIGARIYLVDNKNSGKNMLIQDSLFALNMISHDFKIKWKYELKNLIAGEIHTIDIGKDRKWEYVFGAGNKIYAIDGQGNLVKKFPLVLKDTISIENISVLDYSNTKDYRIVVSDKNGHAYIFNLNGENLDGWKPRILTGKLTDKVRHVRIDNKDVMIAVQQNGIVNLMNRKGEMYPGFPVKLPIESVSSFAFQKGKDFEKTSLVFYSQRGEKISCNFKGSITKKTFGESLLVSDSKGHSFAIAKAEGNGISVQLVNSEKLLHLPFQLKNISLKYCNFSTQGEFIIVKDNSTERLYVYNKEGKSVISDTIVSSEYSEIFYNERRKNFQLYNLRGHTLEMLEF